jgi:hypothetical protein
MLSSIHPLGERARHNSWAVTATAFTIGSILTATAIGAVLGAVGSLASVSTAAALTVIAVTALVAGALDLGRVRAPGPARQVNERWIGAYRGWVYGLAFGAQLGVGVVTFVVTWGVWATFVAELLSGSPLTGAMIGAVFGAGRAIGLIATARIDRPSRLTAFHERMRRLAVPAHRFAAIGTLTVGLLVVGALLVGGMDDGFLAWWGAG